MSENKGAQVLWDMIQEAHTVRDLAAPEIGAGHDGSVWLDWHPQRGSTVGISIHTDGTMVWAGLIDTKSIGHGTVVSDALDAVEKLPD